MNLIDHSCGAFFWLALIGSENSATAALMFFMLCLYFCIGALAHAGNVLRAEFDS